LGAGVGVGVALSMIAKNVLNGKPYLLFLVWYVLKYSMAIPLDENSFLLSNLNLKSSCDASILFTPDYDR